MNICVSVNREKNLVVVNLRVGMNWLLIYIIDKWWGYMLFFFLFFVFSCFWSRTVCNRSVLFLCKRHIFFMKKIHIGASLVAQWLRVCLLMQGTRVRALVWGDRTCREAAGPVSHNYWACASGACAPQQERPRQWEARAPRWRVAPACHN